MPDICKFKFDEGIDKEMIERQLTIAIVAAECTFGKAKVRISAAYCISKEKAQVAIDVSNGVGEHIAQVFVGLMTLQLGGDKFAVERVRDNEPA